MSDTGSCLQQRSQQGVYSISMRIIMRLSYVHYAISVTFLASLVLSPFFFFFLYVSSFILQDHTKIPESGCYRQVFICVIAVTKDELDKVGTTYSKRKPSEKLEGDRKRVKSKSR